VLVPNEAIQTIENKPILFVAEGDGFEARPVAVGRSDAARSESFRASDPANALPRRGLSS